MSNLPGSGYSFDWEQCRMSKMYVDLGNLDVVWALSGGGLSDMPSWRARSRRITLLGRFCIWTWAEATAATWPASTARGALRSGAMRDGVAHRTESRGSEPCRKEPRGTDGVVRW